MSKSSECSSSEPPSTPTQSPIPPRPARSAHRLTMHTPSLSSLASDSSTPGLLPYLSPSSSFSSHQHHSTPTSPSSPETPSIQTPSSARLASPKSIYSIKRKSVPLSIDDIEIELSYLSRPRPDEPLPPLSAPGSVVTTPSFPHPPIYILPVEPHTPTASHPPVYFSTASPPTTPYSHFQPIFTLPEDLPVYAKENQTEPKTLARSLWLWGWIFPLLWFIGMFILWIPLKPSEEEPDPEKAQKLEEMIVILRRAELKYAKRCLYGAIGFTTLVLGLVILGVILSVKK